MESEERREKRTSVIRPLHFYQSHSIILAICYVLRGTPLIERQPSGARHSSMSALNELLVFFAFQRLFAVKFRRFRLWYLYENVISRVTVSRMGNLEDLLALFDVNHSTASKYLGATYCFGSALRRRLYSSLVDLYPQKMPSTISKPSLPAVFREAVVLAHFRLECEEDNSWGKCS